MKHPSRFAVFAVALAFFLALAPFPAAHAQDLDTSRLPVQLKFDFIPGKTYLNTMEMHQTSEIPAQGQTLLQVIDMSAEVSMGVETAPEGKLVTLSYDRIAMKQSLAGTDFAYDSADPSSAQSPLAPLGAVVGKSLKLTVNDKGEFVSVEGLDEMVNSAGGNNPATAEMMKQFTDEDQLSQLMNMAMAQMLASKPVAPGDTWPVEIKTSLGPAGDIIFKGTGKLLGYQMLDGVDVAVIEVDMEIVPPAEAETPQDGSATPNNPLAAMNLKFETGKSKTRLYWDNELGFGRLSEMQQTLTMSMTNPADGSKLTIPTSQTAKTTAEIK